MSSNHKPAFVTVVVHAPGVLDLNPGPGLADLAVGSHELFPATASEGRIAEQAAQINALVRAGNKLANIAFNLKQPSQSLTDSARKCMADSQAEWDAACAALAGSATQSTTGEIVYQYQGRDGEWRGFINDEHYKNTVESGEWPIRALGVIPHDTLRNADSERLDFLIEHEAYVDNGTGHSKKPQYWLVFADSGSIQINTYASPREAITAAIESNRATLKEGGNG